MAGILAGLLVLLVARPVGLIVMIAFGGWWVILAATENKRRDMTRKSLKADHEFECARMDAEYEDICHPIEIANKRLTDAWQAENAAIIAKYQRLCKQIDEENYRQHARWEEAEAARRAKYAEACREIDAMNRQSMKKWEAADSVRKAEYQGVCAPIDYENNKLLADWESKNARITAEFQRERNEIEHENNRTLATWKAENASRQAAYDRACHDVEQDNRRLTSAWEALTATRKAEHDQKCLEIDAKNRRLIASWEAANAPWMAEKKRWQDRVTQAEADVRRLEADLYAQRASTERGFVQRRGEVGGTISSISATRQDYDRELRQAELNSQRIQLEEHLDKSLIRQAKLKGITSDRILSLESFGIETAKDVDMLRNQKVPGIGPVLSQRLFDWRDSLARSFRAQKNLPESERSRIASRFAPVMLPLGQSIQVAINELDTLVLSHRVREAELVKTIGNAVQNLAIAEAHVRAMKVG